MPELLPRIDPKRLFPLESSTNKKQLELTSKERNWNIRTTREEGVFRLVQEDSRAAITSNFVLPRGKGRERTQAGEKKKVIQIS